MITLTDLEFRYSGEKPLLYIPNWQVKPGERVFLHGPSGSGKSTLLHLLCGVLTAHRGSVSICDQNLSTMKPKQRDQFRANTIGQVFQEFNLIPYLNALENIQLAQYFAVGPRAQSSKNALSAAGDLLDTLHLNPQDRLRPVQELSVGQRQRVAIARALVNQPKLLIADEPTSSLDQYNANSFMAFLLEITEKNQTTLVFVSHDLSLSQAFTRVESLKQLQQQPA